MTDKPASLDDVLAVLERLQNVVERAEKRLDAIEQAQAITDNVVDANAVRLAQVDDVADHVLDRSDEIGAELQKVRSNARIARQQLLDPEVSASASIGSRLASRVTAVRVGNRTVMRAVNPR